MMPFMSIRPIAENQTDGVWTIVQMSIRSAAGLKIDQSYNSPWQPDLSLVPIEEHE